MMSSRRRMSRYLLILIAFITINYIIIYNVNSRIEIANFTKWRAECEREQVDQIASILFTGINLTRLDITHHLATKLYNSSYPGIDKHTKYTISIKDLRPLENVTPIDLDDSGKVINDVTSFHYPIDEEQRCQNIDFFFVIISAPENYDRRASIRSTWIKHLMLTDRAWSASYAFLVGRPMNETIQLLLERESSIHSDLIQVDLIDSYKNLTLKSVSLINWAFKKCGQVSFVIKCDDDVYVNVDNMARAFLSNLGEIDNERALYGYLLVGGLPHRSKKEKHDDTKWVVTYEQWPWSNYPTIFALGGMYIISRRALGPLLAATQTTPLYDWEDVYITGLCAEKAKIQFWTADSLIEPLGTPKLPGSCFIRNTVAWHVHSTDHMSVSHKATEDYFFYNTSSPCIITKTVGNNKRTIYTGKVASREKIFKFYKPSL